MLKSLMSLGLGSTVSFKKYALKAQIQVISLPLVTQNGIAKIVGALNSWLCLIWQLYILPIVWEKIHWHSLVFDQNFVDFSSIQAAYSVLLIVYFNVKTKEELSKEPLLLTKPAFNQKYNIILTILQCKITDFKIEFIPEMQSWILSFITQSSVSHDHSIIMILCYGQ